MTISEKTFIEIHSHITSMLETENAAMDHSCIYFSMLGRSILDHHFDIDAKPNIGMCLYAYNLPSEDRSVIAFVDRSGPYLDSSRSGFHCWLETEAYLIDFMSPRFRKMMQNANHPTPCSAETIICKPLSKMKESPFELSSKGDFFLQPNPELTRELLARYLLEPFNKRFTEKVVSSFVI